MNTKCLNQKCNKNAIRIYNFKEGTFEIDFFCSDCKPQRIKESVIDEMIAWTNKYPGFCMLCLVKPRDEGHYCCSCNKQINQMIQRVKDNIAINSNIERDLYVTTKR